MSDPAERLFCQLTSESLELWRAGWPDYFARHRHSGQLIGVEVKRGRGTISPSQARMFEALESAKLPIFVWNPQTPQCLIPWRDYQQKKTNTKSCVALEVLQFDQSILPAERNPRKFTLALLREHLGLTQQQLAERLSNLQFDQSLRSSRKFMLAKIRKQRGLTQQQLAERAQSTQSEISRTERRKDLLVSSLKSYAAALGGELLIEAEINGQLYQVTL